MDAIRIARAATGRDDIVKMEGSYHGHHDTVMFSVVPNADAMGGRDAAEHHADVAGHPRRTSPSTRTSSRSTTPTRSGGCSTSAPGPIACVILEPVMMNIGVVLPEPGYLEAVREHCTRHDVVLIFDEVKSGATIAAGGAIERFGVQPDLACFAKAIGGGTPTAAFGGRADVMDVIEHGAAQQGTFNGNPLVAAAGLAALTAGAHPDAYEHLAHLGTRLAEGCAQGNRRARPPGATPSTSARRAASRTGPEPLTQLPRLPRDPNGVLRGVVPVGREPGRVHDAGRRGAVDDLGAAHRRRHRRLRRGVRRVLRHVAEPA